MQNKPVIITRPEKQSHNLIAGLHSIGRQALVFPLFEIRALGDYSQLDVQLHRLSEFAMVVFVSPNAIDAVFTRLAVLHELWPETCALGVMGAGSRLALHQHGIDARFKVISPSNTEKTDSETFFEELDLPALRGKKVLICRGDSGREFLSSALLAHQIEVIQLCSYERIVPEINETKKQEMQSYLQQNCDWIVTSSAVLKTLITWAETLDIDNAVVKMQQQHIVVPHSRIAQVAQELGFESITLTASGDEKLVLALQSQL